MGISGFCNFFKITDEYYTKKSAVALCDEFWRPYERRRSLSHIACIACERFGLEVLTGCLLAAYSLSASGPKPTLDQDAANVRIEFDVVLKQGCLQSVSSPKLQIELIR